MNTKIDAVAVLREADGLKVLRPGTVGYTVALLAVEKALRIAAEGAATEPAVGRPKTKTTLNLPLRITEWEGSPHVFDGKNVPLFDAPYRGHQKQIKEVIRLVNTLQCTCPSGTGSLAWPCPQHSVTEAPAIPQDAKAERAATAAKDEDQVRKFTVPGSMIGLPYGPVVMVPLADIESLLTTTESKSEARAGACSVSGFSSRVCQLGTKSCTVNHPAAPSGSIGELPPLSATLRNTYSSLTERSHEKLVREYGQACIAADRAARTPAPSTTTPGRSC